MEGLQIHRMITGLVGTLKDLCGLLQQLILTLGDPPGVYIQSL
jgi:hypothetical protein